MRLFTILLFILVPIIGVTQTRRMANSETGWSYTSENQAQSVMPLLQVSERFFKTYDFEEAFFALETAVSQNPSSPEALIVRAKFKRTLGMTADARVDYDKAHRLNPYVADLYGYNGSQALRNLLAIVPETAMMQLSNFQKFGYYHETLDNYILANLASDNEIASVRFALYEFESNRFAEAFNVLNRIISENSSLAIAQDLLGLIYLKEGNIELARRHFQEAIRLDETYAIPWYNPCK